MNLSLQPGQPEFKEGAAVGLKGDFEVKRQGFELTDGRFLKAKEIRQDGKVVWKPGQKITPELISALKVAAEVAIKGPKEKSDGIAPGKNWDTCKVTVNPQQTKVDYQISRTLFPNKAFGSSLYRESEAQEKINHIYESIKPLIVQNALVQAGNQQVEVKRRQPEQNLGGAQPVSPQAAQPAAQQAVAQPQRKYSIELSLEDKPKADQPSKSRLDRIRACLPSLPSFPKIKLPSLPKISWKRKIPERPYSLELRLSEEDLKRRHSQSQPQDPKHPSLNLPGVHIAPPVPEGVKPFDVSASPSNEAPPPPPS